MSQSEETLTRRTQLKYRWNPFHVSVPMEGPKCLPTEFAINHRFMSCDYHVIANYDGKSEHIVNLKSCTLAIFFSNKIALDL